MENTQTTTEETSARDSQLHFDLGTFEGFSFRHQQAMDHILSAEEVVQWDNDANGEAKFWPSGDVPEVALLFKGQSEVNASELLALDELLQKLGDDSTCNFLRIYYAMTCCLEDFSSLTRDKVEDIQMQVWEGTSFLALRKQAAFDLFALYYPKEYRVWEQSHCDSLIFDSDQFLAWPGFSVQEITLGNRKALIVATQ